MNKQSNGYYRKTLFVGVKDTGEVNKKGEPVMKRIYKSVSGKTPEEVEERYYKLRIKLGMGLDILAAEDTFGKWARMYLDERQTEDISLTYMNTLKQAIKHLEPIHHIPIGKVEIQHQKNVIYNLGPRPDVPPGGKVLAKRTLGGINQVAKRVFNLAMEYRAIDFNPANYVRIPKNAT